MSAIEQFLNNDIDLPSPPAIAIRIIEEVKKEESSIDDLAKIISSDPALISKILRVSNSSFYGVSSKVDTLQRAISVLGFDALRNIALSFVIANDFRGVQKGGFDFDLFWKRSVTTAVGSELLRPVLGVKGDDIFITALLQDIGVVIMYLVRGDEYIKVLNEKKVTADPIDCVERSIFGFDHQEVGMALLKKWGLPESIYRPIGFHHKTSDIPEALESRVEILRLSDRLSSLYHGTNCNEKFGEIRSILSSKYGVENDRVEEIVDAVVENSIQFLSIFELDPGNLKPFSQILQDANAELGKMNLTYGQLVIELKEARDKAEKLAGELKAANLKLHKMATVDGLTGLYNHRYFQETMDAELDKANRYRRPLSLALFDLDHFKKVNDKYGHTTGDAVLKAVSAKVSEVVRTSDTLARYGGEEFAIVLPETDLKGAAILCERIRKVVSEMEISSNEHTVQVTISIGVAANGKGLCRKMTLIEVADKALYHSKNSGRNRTSAANANALKEQPRQPIVAMSGR